MNRRNFLSSAAALAGCGAVMPVVEGSPAPSLLAIEPPLGFDGLVLPENAIGVRLAMSTEAFDEMLMELRAKSTSGWGVGADLHVEEDGTRWVLFDQWRPGHDHFQTKEDAIEACRTGSREKRAPFYTMTHTDKGDRADVSEEWRNAKWMVVTILRFKPQPPTPLEPFKLEGVHWINQPPA